MALVLCLPVARRLCGGVNISGVKDHNLTSCTSTVVCRQCFASAPLLCCILGHGQACYGRVSSYCQFDYIMFLFLPPVPVCTTELCRVPPPSRNPVWPCAASVPHIHPCNVALCLSSHCLEFLGWAAVCCRTGKLLYMCFKCDGRCCRLCCHGCCVFRLHVGMRTSILLWEGLGVDGVAMCTHTCCVHMLFAVSDRAVELCSTSMLPCDGLGLVVPGWARKLMCVLTFRASVTITVLK